jgi:hypothetical protein
MVALVDSRGLCIACEWGGVLGLLEPAMLMTDT